MKATSLLIISFFLFPVGSTVLAQETELPDPGLTPDSPFYFLELLIEEIGSFFTFDDLKKAERCANLAAERLAEAQAVIEKGRPELAERTLERYRIQLQNSLTGAEGAQNQGQNTEEVMARVGTATSRHLEVLAEIYEQVPEEARLSIENAMTASVKGHERAVDTLKAKNALGEVPEWTSLPAGFPQEVRERIQTRVQQELEIEETLEDIDTSKSLRDICLEQGGSSETCEQFPLEAFETFKEIEDFCLEQGGPAEMCATLEDKCEEYGVTTANECLIFLSVASVKAYQSVELEAVPVSASFGEGAEVKARAMEENRNRVEIRVNKK